MYIYDFNRDMSIKNAEYGALSKLESVRDTGEKIFFP